MTAVARMEDAPPVSPAGETTTMLAAIQRLAENPNLDLDRFERLLQMQERLQEREAKRLFDEAMSGMQPDLPIIGERGKSNNNTYAKWSDISEQIKPVLAKHGFSLTHRSKQTDGKIEVTAIVSHHAGHREETTIASPPDKGPGRNDIQAIGSALSYLQRYTAKLLLNLTSRLDGDDDGKATSDGSTLITEDQIMDMRELLESTGANVAQFLRATKVERLEDIETKKFDSLCAAIKRRAAERTAK